LQLITVIYNVAKASRKTTFWSNPVSDYNIGSSRAVLVNHYLIEQNDIQSGP